MFGKFKLHKPLLFVIVGGIFLVLLSMLTTSLRSNHQAQTIVRQCSKSFLVPGYVESYSLWMMPDATSEQNIVLQREIDTSSALYKTPRFPAHVTLLPDIKMASDEVLERTRNLVKVWWQDEHLKEGWKATFQKVKRGSSYFQCVYILLEMDPTVMRAATIAREVFKMESVLGPYMPHLSLVYADMTDEEKVNAVQDIELRLLGSDQAKKKLKLEGLGFASGKVSVWYTPTEDKTLESWCWVGDVST